jgi:transposase-like protein
MLDQGGSSREVKSPRLEYFGVTIKVDPAGRRAWPVAISRRLAVESFRSPLSVEAYAREWDVSPSVLSKWRMELTKEQQSPPITSMGENSGALAFAPLVCEKVLPRETMTPLSGVLEFELSGVLARLPIDTTPERIRDVLRAMRDSE